MPAEEPKVIESIKEPLDPEKERTAEVVDLVTIQDESEEEYTEGSQGPPT